MAYTVFRKNFSMQLKKNFYSFSLLPLFCLPSVDMGNEDKWGQEGEGEENYKDYE